MNFVVGVIFVKSSYSLRLLRWQMKIGKTKQKWITQNSFNWCWDVLFYIQFL